MTYMCDFQGLTNLEELTLDRTAVTDVGAALLTGRVTTSIITRACTCANSTVLYCRELTLDQSKFAYEWSCQLVTQYLCS